MVANVKSVGWGMTVLDDRAELVLKERYYQPGEDWDALVHRVCENITRAEKGPHFEMTAWYAKFYELILTRKFLPNSPTLMNAGGPLQQLSACFGLPVPDSIDGIFNAVKNGAIIHQSGGGTGYNFSNIRPAGSEVKSTDGIASGPLSFIKVFDEATNTIKQGGKRRGANMGLLHCDHPDIQGFVQAKEGSAACKECGSAPPYTNFNFSVLATDEFMETTLKKEKPLLRVFVDNSLFGSIAYWAWKNGEPGIVFYDSINQDNTCPHLGPLDTVNPCSELPLRPYESCNLGSMNLSKYVDVYGNFEFSEFGEDVQTAVRFLDNVITMNRYPLPEIMAATLETRKIGLGVMGFHDALIKMGISYDSDECINLIGEIGGALNDNAVFASEQLGIERGSFPAFKGSLWDNEGYMAMRNATHTAIAPTGSISAIANCSSGIEPIPALEYDWHVMGETIKVIHSSKKTGLTEQFPGLVRTATEIDPLWHLAVLAEWQTHIQNGVSKTIMLPEYYAVEDVRNIFFEAWRKGCKGITVYRDGSREGQPIQKCDTENGGCVL